MVQAKLADEIGEIVFEDGSDHKDIALICPCGRPVLRFIGFRVYRNVNGITSVVCECESGHESVVELVDISGSFSDGVKY